MYISILLYWRNSSTSLLFFLSATMKIIYISEISLLCVRCEVPSAPPSPCERSDEFIPAKESVSVDHQLVSISVRSPVVDECRKTVHRDCWVDSLDIDPSKAPSLQSSDFHHSTNVANAEAMFPRYCSTGSSFTDPVQGIDAGPLEARQCGHDFQAHPSCIIGEPPLRS